MRNTNFPPSLTFLKLSEVAEAFGEGLSEGAEKRGKGATCTGRDRLPENIWGFRFFD